MDNKKATGGDVDPGAAAAIVAGTHTDPFAVLGPHAIPGEAARRLTVFDPGANRITAIQGSERLSLEPVPQARGLFSGEIPDGPYELEGEAWGRTWMFEDPYRFGPVLGEMDEHLFAEGTHTSLWRALGAHVMEHEGALGTHFAVWAPNATRVSVVGDFNAWNGRQHIMRRRGSTGIWEIFMPGLGEGTSYKYEILGADGRPLPLKADPVGFGAQHAPETASVVRDIGGYGWHDKAWMESRAAANSVRTPISIYEVHLGSWKRADGGRPLSYKELAEDLVRYAKDMGFTHLEFLPVSEHPFDGSWGYQPVGLYAPTVRHGPPHEFRDLVDAAHQEGIGVILDWVPGHFPTDAHGLGLFDGTHLYEHSDPKEGFHQDWNTLIYNFGRTEVRNFLTANALYWLEEYHVDGLRVDAVASMLYRDYSRKEGEWVPNKDGGRENLEAISLLQEMNSLVYGRQDGILTAAEESTSFPKVSRPVHEGGLGFGFKWNMGWMNDTLSYIEKDPIYRQHHHHQMTFGMAYHNSENFILPISHDEVVHGKGSMIAKMPGHGDDQFANLRAYYGFMWAHPGKKLLFMGCEFAQGREWNHAGSLDWHLLDYPQHQGVQALIRDLNALYRETPALYVHDCEPGGFQWLEANAADQSVYAFLREGGESDAPVVAISNFTPVQRDWTVGLPLAGRWSVALDTDSPAYGGRGSGTGSHTETIPKPYQNQPHSAGVTLAPLSTIFLKHESSSEAPQ
ncbi:1,4-alpha-glucan branching protein GlgB [Algicella marina]|uniref:1,4-alpha-glucan branching enzyme GlgB n=1 Tax=Algicella marina TaxID=2683284 RepID=A0A6P1SY89_9RHOB|nr:1,4-alpha-glucan branching protein GlgB [Algicella marina]QHQ34176.1 1,4-alpha-glucan branching protein GlgB [Algicella marina]